MVAVDLSEEAYTAMRLSSWHEVGSKTVRRCIAPQPVLTHYKLREIERLECGIFAPPQPPGGGGRWQRRARRAGGSPSTRRQHAAAAHSKAWRGCAPSGHAA